MSAPDPTAAAAIDGDGFIRPVWFVFMDFFGDPARANSSGFDVTVVGSGLPDLDGDYIGLDNRICYVSPVKVRPGGTDTVTARLSGLRGLDEDDREMLADRENWQGRLVRLWRLIRDENDTDQGGFQHYYTGYMMGLTHNGDKDSLMLELTIEGYLSAFSKASHRNLLSQEDEFDELDYSARGTIAIYNGSHSSPLVDVPNGNVINTPAGPVSINNLGGRLNG